MIAADELEELKAIYPEAKIMSEAGMEYVYLPSLSLPQGASPAVAEALLCPQQHSGYLTRLFLASPVSGRGNNWTPHHILGRVWHTWSWNNVPASLRLTQILVEHLRGLR